jgi:Fe2+ transport system protein FeoA
VPLSDLRPGQQAIVQRVRNDDPALLRHLESLGIMPQARLSVLDYSGFDGNLSLQVNDTVQVLGPNVTQQIFVEVP